MSKKMYCKNCGEQIDINKLKAPRRCEKCGCEIKIVIDVGIVVYVLATIVLALAIIAVVKNFMNNEIILFIVFAIEVVIIPNCVEKILYKYGILKYTNTVKSKT